MVATETSLFVYFFCLKTEQFSIRNMCGLAGLSYSLYTNATHEILQWRKQKVRVQHIVGFHHITRNVVRPNLQPPSLLFIW